MEQIHVYLNLTFTRRGQLRIALVSPAGTRSVLLPPRGLDAASGPLKFDRWPLASVQFWGERAAGAWRLEVENVGPSHNAGHLTWGSLMLYGVDGPALRLRPPTRAQPQWFRNDFARYVVKDGDVMGSKPVAPGNLWTVSGVYESFSRMYPSQCDSGGGGGEEGAGSG